MLPLHMNQLSINLFHLAMAIQIALQIGNVETWSTTMFNNLLDDVSIEVVTWLNLAKHHVV